MRFYHRTTNTAKAECLASPVPRLQCRSYSSKRTKQQEAGSREPDPEQEILTTHQQFPSSPATVNGDLTGKQ